MSKDFDNSIEEFLAYAKSQGAPDDELDSMKRELISLPLLVAIDNKETKH